MMGARRVMILDLVVMLVGFAMQRRRCPGSEVPLGSG